MTDPHSVEKLKAALQRLPGVGPKSAQRMAFHLLERDREGARQIGEALRLALSRVKHCQRCHNFSETELCDICISPKRNLQIVCVVETPADLESIEIAAIYKGSYYVLMGHLSPLDGVGPDELGINGLLHLVKNESVEEVILATNMTTEGQATADFLYDLLQKYNTKVTRLARGMPVGGELEYMDANTINQAFSGRQNMS